MIGNILVLGAGSAGLIAAISLKRKLPQLAVRIVRSKEIGVIGVGESTTPNVPVHLFTYMGIPPAFFYEKVRPTWKMGIHFIWGPRKHFDYGFGYQLDQQWTDLKRPNGFYCDDEFSDAGLCQTLMAHGKAFPRRRDGGPDIPGWHALHVENVKMVACLEEFARGIGIDIIEANVRGGEKGPNGVGAVVLEDGRRLEADLYIDASGFRSELLGRTLEEPFVSFADSLFCDRAVVGSWDRTTEPIMPYTTAETMDSGWCWQIEHQETINRGYVYSSGAISDDDARAEFVRKNPKVKPLDRLVHFRSGRYQRGWAQNVVAIGNSGGFVEPLESTGLMMVCYQSGLLADILGFTMLAAPPTVQKVYNDMVATSWHDIRSFLTLHYWANTRLDTPFWRHARGDADISCLQQLLAFYDENGPTGLLRYAMPRSDGSVFGVEGYLVMLVGSRVPYKPRYKPSDAEWAIWRRHQAELRATAVGGLTPAEALSWTSKATWQWLGPS